MANESKPPDINQIGEWDTKLSPQEERVFRSWISDQSKKIGRDLTWDLYDYDVRGQFKELGGKDIPFGHGPDTWKKPTHPTFSNESVYHKPGKAEGGKWVPSKNPDEIEFHVSPWMLQQRRGDKGYWQKYFDFVAKKDAERGVKHPKVRVILPQESAPPKPQTQLTPAQIQILLQLLTPPRMR